MLDTPNHASAAHRDDEPAELPIQGSASLDGLRREWRRLYRNEPPRISRDLLMRGIGYRLQENQHGGLASLPGAS